jgi:hypothetical protein
VRRDAKSNEGAPVDRPTTTLTSRGSK